MRTFLLIILIWIGFFLYACTKDEPQGYGEEQFCNCGIICQDSIHSQSQTYFFIVENECSGNEKAFIVDQLIYSAYYEGQRICINDQKPW
jgi:hypothetical protein